MATNTIVILAILVLISGIGRWLQTMGKEAYFVKEEVRHMYIRGATKNPPAIWISEHNNDSWPAQWFKVPVSNTYVNEVLDGRMPLHEKIRVRLIYSKDKEHGKTQIELL